MIYLIRHGATDFNESKPPILQGKGVDMPLNDNGESQANRVAKFLASKNITKIFSSPMKRAYGTAEFTSKETSSPIQIVDELVECSLGLWEGLSWDQIKEKYSVDYQWFKGDTGHRTPPQGESYKQVLNRIAPFFESLDFDENIAVFTHGIVNKAFIAGRLGISLKFAKNLPQDNCGINILSGKQSSGSYYGSLTINYTEHLL